MTLDPNHVQAAKPTAKHEKKRRRRYYPLNPAKVLSTAIYAGLATLVRLASSRVTSHKEVQKLYVGIEEMWRDAQAKYKHSKKKGTKNFSIILKVEHNIRKNYLGMLWWTTKPYGNREFKRVYSWREGTIGPLNNLLNYAGAQLRNMAAKYYIFPKPTYYQVRKYENGKREVLHRSPAMKYPPKNGVKTKWIAVYSGNSKYPNVRVRHTTLPELDFVDMIRAHVIELVRQCFIYNVPQTASQRYIRLLIYRLRPFLDWVYTSGKHGRKNFWPEADQELRNIVLEIRALYGRRVGRRQRLTQQLEYGVPSRPTVDIFENFAKEALKRDPSKEMKKSVRNLRLLVENHYLTNEDAENFLNLILAISQTEGNDWHKILFSDMYQPRSLKQAVFAGDNYVSEKTNLLIAAEVPVHSVTDGGKADLVVFIRRKVRDSIVWMPVMVLDVKTKTGINWSILGKKPRTKKIDTRVPTYDIRKRQLTESEWNTIIESTPSKRELRQLESYEQALLDEYSRITKDDSSAPQNLWKGIIILDTHEDTQQLFLLLPWLIKSVLSYLDKPSSSRILFTPGIKGENKKNQPKLGIILTSPEGPYKLLKNTIPVASIVEENPFKDRVKDDRHFALYLTVASGGSSGESAAWIARNWHLLHHLIDLKRNYKEPPEIVWLDLLGNFSVSDLALERLRLTGSQKPKKVPRRNIVSLTGLVEEVQFQNLSDEIDEYFFKNSLSGQKRLQTRIRKIFKKRPLRERMVIVDGWATLRNIIPRHLDSLTNALESSLLDWIPKEYVELIWLDRAVPHPLMCSTYQRTKVTSLPHDSLRRNQIDEIIWNLPSSPRNFGWSTPRREDIRIIVQDLPVSTQPHMTPFGVPQLKGWARRFRADSSVDRTVTEEEVMESIVGEAYTRLTGASSIYVEIGNDSEETMLSDVFDLVPSLCRLKGDNDNDEIYSEITNNIYLESKQLSSVSPSKGILERIKFEPYIELQRLEQSSEYSPSHEITRGWMKRNPSETEDVVRTMRRPPTISKTPSFFIDTEKTRTLEVLRIYRSIKFLKSVFPDVPDDWNSLMNKILTLCKMGIRRQSGILSPFQVLQEVQNLLATDKESISEWKLLNYDRQQLEYETHPTISNVLKDIIKKNKGVLTLYGNALFLLVLGVKKKKGVDFPDSYIEILWKSVAEWQFIHMGFKPRKFDEIDYRYDVSAIWSNLLFRTEQLISGPLPVRPFERYRLGEAIQPETGGLWLVFQESAGSDNMIAIYMKESASDFPEWGYYDAVSDLSDLGNGATAALEYSKRIPIVITSLEGKDLLWAHIIDPEPGHEWNLLGQITHSSPPERKSIPVKWVRIFGIPSTILSQINQPKDVNISEEFTKLVNRTLRAIAEE